MIVLDCSAAIAIARKTKEGNALLSLVNEGEIVGAPNFYGTECGNVVWKYIRSGELDEVNLADVLSYILNLVDVYYEDHELLVEAVSSSVKLNHSVYDMLYLVLARRTGATLFTLDKKLAALCRREGVNCLQEAAL